MEARDNWSKVEIVAQVISAIFLPVALLVVGRIYDVRQNQQQQLEDNANRLTSLIDHLSSEVPRERELAITVTHYLAAQGQLPEELVPVVTLVAIDDENQQVAESAREALSTAVQQQPELKTTIVESARPTSNPDSEARPDQSEITRQTAAAEVVAEVVATPATAAPETTSTQVIAPNDLKIAYIQYRRDRSQAEQLQTYLEAQGISVPAIEQTADIALNDIRYANRNDRTLAENLKTNLEADQDITIDQLINLSSTGYEVPQGQIEIWLKD
ncbi:MAG: hypothetical protein AAGI45_14310 [Cyanobacteria bacterium P01_H01_bin.26]